MTQFVGRDVINKKKRLTWLYAVQLGQLSSVELSCVAINTPLFRPITTNATLCVLYVDVRQISCVCISCMAWDISAMATPIGVKVCMMVRIELCPGPRTIELLPFWWPYLYGGHQMRGQERGSGGPCLASQSLIFAT